MTEVPTLVLLPGLDGTGQFFAPLLRALPAHLPVQIFAYPFDPAMGYAALISYVAERLPAGRLVLLGESFSGPIAVALARNLPDRVAGLILAASFVKAPAPGILRHLLALPGFMVLAKALVVFVLLGLYSGPETAAQVRETIATMPLPVIRRRLAAVLTVDKSEAFRQANCPVLNLYSRYDCLLPPFLANRIIRRLRPDARMQGFPAPHMLLLAQPMAAAAEIVRFIDAVSG